MLTIWVLVSDLAHIFGRAINTGRTSSVVPHRQFLQNCSPCFTLQASLQILSPSSGHRKRAVHTLQLTLSGCREACKLDPKYITNFGEEVVRGQPVFVLSILLQRLEPMLREAAGVAPWQVSRRHTISLAYPQQQF